MTYGELVRQAREAENLTQAELAELIRTDRSTVSRIESGKVPVDPAMFRALTLALRTLSPVKLVNALGYEVPTNTSDRLPPELVRLCSQLNDDQTAVVLQLTRGLLALSDGSQRKGR